MKKQKGFIDLTLGHIITFAVVCGVVGYATIRALEWLWPFVKAVIHGATAQ